jgi:hypothetical protein
MAQDRLQQKSLLDLILNRTWHGGCTRGDDAELMQRFRSATCTLEKTNSAQTLEVCLRLNQRSVKEPKWKQILKTNTKRLKD